MHQLAQTLPHHRQLYVFVKLDVAQNSSKHYSFFRYRILETTMMMMMMMMIMSRVMV